MSDEQRRPARTSRTSEAPAGVGRRAAGAGAAWRARAAGRRGRLASRAARPVGRGRRGRRADGRGSAAPSVRARCDRPSAVGVGPAAVERPSVDRLASAGSARRRGRRASSGGSCWRRRRPGGEARRGPGRRRRAHGVVGLWPSCGRASWSARVGRGRRRRLGGRPASVGRRGLGGRLGRRLGRGVGGGRRRRRRHVARCGWRRPGSGLQVDDRARRHHARAGCVAASTMRAGDSRSATCWCSVSAALLLGRGAARCRSSSRAWPCTIRVWKTTTPNTDSEQRDGGQRADPAELVADVQRVDDAGDAALGARPRGRGRSRATRPGARAGRRGAARLAARGRGGGLAGLTAPTSTGGREPLGGPQAGALGAGVGGDLGGATASSRPA